MSASGISCCGTIVSQQQTQQDAATANNGGAVAPVAPTPAPSVIAGGPTDEVEGGGTDTCMCAPVQPAPASGIAPAAQAVAAAPAPAPVAAAPVAPAPTATTVTAGGPTAPAPAPVTGTVVDASTGQAVATTQPTASPQTTTIIDPNTGQPIANVTVSPIVGGTAASPATVATAPTAATSTGVAAPGTAATAVGAANGPAAAVPAAATAPATTLPTWNNWVGVFSQLGLGQSDIQAIGAQNLNDQQLALVYTKIKDELTAAGVQPGTGTSDTNGTQAAPKPTAWNDDWAKKFQDAGVSDEQIKAIAEQAKQVGATDAQLQDLLAQAQQMPGWNDDWQKKFMDLGMPPQVVAQFKSAQAPASGLQAAYDNAKQRIDAFKKDGYYDKFVKEGVKPEEIWSIVLSDKVPSNKELDQYLNQTHVGNQPTWKKFAEMGLSFVPGYNLAEYISPWGKKFLTGEDVNHKDPMTIAFAALSGVTAFTALRGVANIARGVKALDGGMTAVKAAGIAPEGAAALADAAGGATSTMTLGQKIAAFIPMTSAHKSAQFAAQMSSAAGYATAEGGGYAKLLAAGTDEGKMQVQGLKQMFTDIGSGAVTGRGGKMAYWGSIKRMIPFKGAADPLVLQGDNVLKVTKSINASAKNGDVILGNLLKVTGDKIALNPSWVQTIGADGKLTQAFSSEALKDLGNTVGANTAGFGKIFAADGAKALGLMEKGGLGGKVLPGSLQYLQAQTKAIGETPSWFKSIVSTAGGKAGGAAVATVGGSMVMSKVAEGTAVAHSAATAGAGAAETAKAAGAGAKSAPELGKAGTSAADAVDGAKAVTPKHVDLPMNGKERVWSNGTVKHFAKDGSAVTEFADGSVKEVAANGSIAITQPNGIRITYKNQAMLDRSMLAKPAAPAAPASTKLVDWRDNSASFKAYDPTAGKLTNAQQDAVAATADHLGELAEQAGTLPRATGPGGAVLLG